MAEQVGKSADDPGSFTAQHAKSRVSRTRMRNGNTEEEYRTGLGMNCRVFFEIDSTRRIVNWRYALPDDDCILASGPK